MSGMMTKVTMLEVISEITAVGGRKLKMRIFCLIPVVITTLLRGYFEMCSSKVAYEGEPLVNLMKLVFNITLMVFLILTCLKLDNYIKWSWNQVTFPFWIIFSIMVIGSLICLSFFLTSLCPILTCKSKDYQSLLCHGWVNANTIGVAVLSATLQLTIVSVLEKGGSTQGIARTFIAVTIYTLVMLIFTSVSLSPLMKAMSSIEKEVLTVHDPTGLRSRFRPSTVIPRSSRQPNENLAPETERTAQEDKNKSSLEIPRYLVKVSSSLFKTATAAEIFLTNMEKQKKKTNSIRKKDNINEILKVGDSSQNLKAASKKSNDPMRRENTIHNLMSEPSQVIQPKRRKSIEVLMADISQPSRSNGDANGKPTRLESQISVLNSVADIRRLPGSHKVKST